MDRYEIKETEDSYIVHVNGHAVPISKDAIRLGGEAPITFALRDFDESEPVAYRIVADIMRKV